jgi:hypothetical protein
VLQEGINHHWFHDLHSTFDALPSIASVSSWKALSNIIDFTVKLADVRRRGHN